MANNKKFLYIANNIFLEKNFNFQSTIVEGYHQTNHNWKEQRNIEPYKYKTLQICNSIIIL